MTRGAARRGTSTGSTRRRRAGIPDRAPGPSSRPPRLSATAVFRDADLRVRDRRELTPQTRHKHLRHDDERDVVEGEVNAPRHSPLPLQVEVQVVIVWQAGVETLDVAEYVRI